MIDNYEMRVLEAERSHNIENALANFYSKDKIVDKMRVLNKMKSLNGINLVNTRRKINSQQAKQRFNVKTVNFGHEQIEQLNIDNRKPTESKVKHKMLTERNLKDQIQVAKYFRYNFALLLYCYNINYLFDLNKSIETYL